MLSNGNEVEVSQNIKWEGSREFKNQVPVGSKSGDYQWHWWQLFMKVVMVAILVGMTSLWFGICCVCNPSLVSMAMAMMWLTQNWNSPKGGHGDDGVPEGGWDRLKSTSLHILKKETHQDFD